MKQMLEQKRAAHALRLVRLPAAQNRDWARKMATHINKTPIRILNNGLGQALAFLVADNGGARGDRRKESGVLYDHLTEWLCGEPDEAHPRRIYPAGDLLERLMEGDQTQYFRAQEEALALFVWLRKFADAYLKTEEQEGAR